MHPFEQTGHGPGPFKEVNRYYDDDEDGGMHCQHCGTFIKEICEIENGEGRIFIVGNKCVNLAAIDDFGLRESHELWERIYKQQRRIEKPRLKAKLSRLKHPVRVFRERGQTMYDYFRYMLHARTETAMRVLPQVEGI